MLHEENSEAFVRHHFEQHACSNTRGVDTSRPNFLPEKCQIAVCQRDEMVGSFQSSSSHEVGLSKNMYTGYPLIVYQRGIIVR